MPSLNYDYTQSLRRNNALYLLKYANDPVQVADNPIPVAGYSGHVPSYRSSIHDQRVIRSLMRSLASPMKPTTATGFIQSSKNQSRFDHETKENVTSQPTEVCRGNERAKSAPVPTTRQVSQEKTTERAHTDGCSEVMGPSRLAMMSAGGSNMPAKIRPNTTLSKRAIVETPTSRHTARSRSSNASSISMHSIPRCAGNKHPTGYPQTLYGASYWFAWPDEKRDPKPSRPTSYQRDRNVDRNNNVIYHKYEGVVPKYMGYVPGYKFRHGSTYGVLTVRATDAGAVYKLNK